MILRMGRRPVVAVFGSNNLAGAPDIEPLCEELGRAIAGLGCRVVCGGLGGVMTAVCRGAKGVGDSSVTIGLLPGEDAEGANPFVDIVVPTGLGIARNLLVARAADACIAVRGGSGTLSEIAFAWQIRKPVAVMIGSGGWAERLAGTTIDHRRPEDEVVALRDVTAAVEWLRQVLGIRPDG